MKKIKLKHIIVFLVVWNLVFGSIFYFLYMNRVERLFGTVKKDVLKSEILKDEIGVVKKAKFKNFMQWISVENDKECIKMQVVTEENNKYKICTIIEIVEEEVIVKGYIVGDKVIYEENENDIEKIFKDELGGEFVGIDNSYIKRIRYIFENNKATACYVEVIWDEEFFKGFNDDNIDWDSLYFDAKEIDSYGPVVKYEMADEYFVDRGKGESKKVIKEWLESMEYKIINE